MEGGASGGRSATSLVSSSPGAGASQPCPRGPERHVDRFGRARGDEPQALGEPFAVLRLELGGVEVSAPDDRDPGARAFRAVQEQRDFRIGARARGGLRPQVEIGGHDNGGVGPRRGERVRGELREGAHEGTGPEIDDALRREVFKRLPRASGAVGVDRIVGVRRHVLGRREDRAGGADGPSAPVEPPEALAERVERRGLGHKGVEIDVDPDFEALCGDDDEAARGVAGGAGPERREHRGEPFALDGTGAADEEDPVALVAERPERAAGEVHPVDDDGDGVRAGTVGDERGEQLARGACAGVGKRLGAGPDRAVERRGLRGAKPGSEYRMGAVAAGERQPVLARGPGRR